jgi:hypothetical protein
MDQKVFPIARGSSAPLWFCGVIGVLLFALGVFLASFWFFGSRIATLELSDRGLRVRGDVYGRFIPKEALRIGQAKVLDLAADESHAPVARTNGIGLPTYQSGWFRLANDSSALLFVTDWSRAVLVPTTERFDLIVSPSDPQAFLAALNRPTATGATFALASPPASASSGLPALLLLLCSLLPLAIAALMGYVAYSTRHVRFEVSEASLRIRGDLFGRQIPRSSLRVADAQIIDLKSEKKHRPILRTMGVGLPGYGSGWFRLQDGSKGLLFLTDPSRAVYLPTTEAYTLLISPADPEGFLAALRA